MCVKKLLQKTVFFLAALLWIGNVSAQYQCEGDNMLSSVDFNFQPDNTYYAPNWSQSTTDFTGSWSNGVFTLHLNNATSAQWQAQFPLRCTSQPLEVGKTYFLSYDIQTNKDLPLVYIKIHPQGNDGDFIEIPVQKVSAGTHTISGISVSTTSAFDEILFDFGGSPADVDITISKLTLCADYSLTEPTVPTTFTCNGDNLLSSVKFQVGGNYYAPNWANSSNYTETFDNGVLTLNLGDATTADWQAQFPITCTSQTIDAGKTYLLSFDIQTSVDLPRVYIKLQAAADNDHFVDLPGQKVLAGTHTISGFCVNTTSAFDEILFDFGGNPANADIVISNIVLCDDYLTYPVTLKVIDQSKGTITNASDHNKTNIFCWIDSNLAALNPLSPGNWWYPLYDTSIADGADVNITPNGELVQGTDDWTWDIALNAAPGMYQWNPYAKSLNWSPINPDMYVYTGDNGNNLIFTVSSTGEVSGNTELVIPNSTGDRIANVGLDNAAVMGGKSIISATFDGEANVAVYTIQGTLLKQTVAQNTFSLDGLPTGTYLVKINNAAYKVVVQ